MSTPTRVRSRRASAGARTKDSRARTIKLIIYGSAEGGGHIGEVAHMIEARQGPGQPWSAQIRRAAGEPFEMPSWLLDSLTPYFDAVADDPLGVPGQS